MLQVCISFPILNFLPFFFAFFYCSVTPHLWIFKVTTIMFQTQDKVVQCDIFNYVFLPLHTTTTVPSLLLPHHFCLQTHCAPVPQDFIEMLVRLTPHVSNDW